MSNKTTLQTNNNKLSTNNTDLASILNTINNLPEAGSGGSGGGSVDTCTVTLNSTYASNMASITATIVENGEIKIKTVSNINSTSYTINNVLCGSPIILLFFMQYDWSVSYSGGASLSGWMEHNNLKYITAAIPVFKAPTTAGANSIITITDED